MKRIAPVVLAFALLANFGCHMFSKSKNPAAPKESNTVAADDERDFMRRWIDKRASDLVAAGNSSMSARDQAVAEFKVKFSYMDVARQAK
jgi:hypothetical protein